MVVLVLGCDKYHRTKAGNTKQKGEEILQQIFDDWYFTRTHQIIRMIRYLGRWRRKKVTVVQMRMKARLHSLAWLLLPVLWRFDLNTFLLSSAVLIFSTRGVWQGGSLLNNVMSF